MAQANPWGNMTYADRTREILNQFKTQEVDITTAYIAEKAHMSSASNAMDTLRRLEAAKEIELIWGPSAKGKSKVVGVKRLKMASTSDILEAIADKTIANIDNGKTVDIPAPDDSRLTALRAYMQRELKFRNGLENLMAAGISDEAINLVREEWKPNDLAQEAMYALSLYETTRQQFASVIQQRDTCEVRATLFQRQRDYWKGKVNPQHIQEFMKNEPK